MRSEGRQHQSSRLGSCSYRLQQLEASYQGKHSDKQAEERGSVGSEESADGRGQHQQPWSQVQPTPTVTATELVTPRLGYTATAGTATQPLTNP